MVDHGWSSGLGRAEGRRWFYEFHELQMERRRRGSRKEGPGKTKINKKGQKKKKDIKEGHLTCLLVASFKALNSNRRGHLDTSN